MMKSLILLHYICFLAVSANPSRVGKDIEIPSGPCLFNSNKLKCTDNGFYEMVQCDGNSCFCVDSHNGQIAELSRTTSNKVAPRCSDCYISIYGKFKGNQLPDFTYIPKCDNQHGFYEALQCQGDTCYCVDPKSGSEIAGSRQKNGLNNNISCKNESDSNNQDGKQDLPVAQPFCKLEHDAGYSCSDGNSRTMYHFDPSTFTCLAFKYNGCGGNLNRFVSDSECHSSCLMLDFSSCAFLKTPAIGKNKETITCGGPIRFGKAEDSCPQGYKCVMGAFFGFCCPQESEEKMSKAYQPRCATGKPYSTNTDGYENILFGKKCSDNFCPNNFKCIQNEIFAHCCPL
ncbi:unnamed protein product [Auanema sp. JU1783]|nr:unnamed protein product [Auanema sp. JU1783]